MTGLDLLSVLFGGLGVLMLALSLRAKPTGGYREPLDPFGSQSVFERDFSRHEADYNRNPRAAVAKGGIAFIVVAILLQSFKLF